QQVSRVDPKRPQEFAVADEDASRLRMLAKNLRHRLHQKVRPIPFLEVGIYSSRKYINFDK
ncbi:MAG: hypothetical protein ACM3KJ_14100, partial [Bacillota bacterium]